MAIDLWPLGSQALIFAIRQFLLQTGRRVPRPLASKLGLWLIVALVITTLPPRLSPQTTSAGNLSGTLYWNGSPVQGNGTGTIFVLVPAVTGSYINSSGSFTFNSIAAGSYAVNVYGNGCALTTYLLGSSSAIVPAGATVIDDIDLTSTAGRVQGTVYLNGTPMPSPNISIDGLCGQWQTGPTGTFSHFLPPGSYTARVNNSSGFSIGTFNFTISAGQTTDVGIVNVNTTVVSGQVLWNGAPVSGLGVTNLFAFVQNIAGSYIGSDGSFSLTGIPSGTYNLNIYGNGCSQPNYQLGSTSITSTGGTLTTNVDISGTAGRVTGVITVNGSPFPNPRISISGLCGQWQSLSDGSFAHYLPPGSYSANVAGSAGTLGALNFTIVAGQTTDLSAVNFNAGNLTAPLLWNGAPVSGSGTANLTAALYSGSTFVAANYLNGALGAFSFSGVGPGAYQVLVYQNGCVDSADQISDSVPVTIIGGLLTTANIDISATAGRVAGWVTVNGVALPSPQIAVAGLCGNWETNTDGTFLHYLAPGNYSAQITGPSGPLGTFSFTIVAGQTTRADFEVAGSSPSATVLTSSANPSVAGQTVTFTATVSGSSATPTGSVAFYDSGTLLTAAPLVGGQAAYATSSLTQGTHQITAAYSGDATNSSSTSATVSQNVTAVVNQGPTITSGNGTTFTVGMAGSFTVMATGSPTPTLSEAGILPTGISFIDNGNGTASLSGIAAAGTTGTYPIMITASNGVSSDAVQSFTLMVNAGPAITSGNVTTFTVGTAGSFSVMTTGMPTPTLSEMGALPNGVTFNAATGLLSGTPAAGTGGTYAITFTASNGVSSDAVQSFTLMVNAGPAITSGNVTTFIVGTVGSFSVMTTGMPTPTLSEMGALPNGVTFNAATGLLSGTPAAGTGGTYPIIITASNGVSSDAIQSFTLTVNDVIPVISWSTPVAITYGVTLSSAQLNATANVPGTFAYNPPMGTLPAVGTQTLMVTFTPTDMVHYTTTTASVLLVVNKANSTVTLGASPNPSVSYQTVTLTAAIAPQFGGSASGTITFLDGVTSLGRVSVSNNAASLNVSTLALGAHPITASYSGDANLTSSTSSSVSQVVNKAATIGVVTPSANPAFINQTITYTATVSGVFGGSPTGTVTFKNGATTLGTATVSGGQASINKTFSSAGTKPITAIYSGDANFTGNTSPALSELITKYSTSTAMVSSLNPSTYGQSLTFTATVSSTFGMPAGTVTFKNGTTTLGTSTLGGGVATFITSNLGVGSKSITAVYNGNTAFAASSSTAVQQVVTKATTTVALVSSLNPSTPGQTVIFTATVSPQFSLMPTGSVTFRDGTKSLKTVALSGGTATFATSTLGLGMHNIAATYNGNANFAISAGGTTQTVN